MQRFNYHTHTNYSDGENTVREMVEAAIACGFVDIGFSDHAPIPQLENETWCMTEKDVARQTQQIETLKSEYRGRIRIFRGLEVDAQQLYDKKGLDYCIGSVHIVAQDGGYYGVDCSKAQTEHTVETGFSGDALRYAKTYYQTLVSMVQRLKPDIIGHFDVVTKFDEAGVMFPFDTNCAYRNVALEAMDAVLDIGGIVEVNTGAISRGARKTPYPRRFLLERVLQRGGSITLTSDSHSIHTLDYAFSETEAWLREIGFSETMQLTESGFVPARL